MKNKEDKNNSLYEKFTVLKNKVKNNKENIKTIKKI